MNRRDFITLVTGTAAAWSIAARAQQSGRVRHIVFLHALPENDPEAQARTEVFREALAQLGWTQRNVQIEQRFSSGDLAQMHSYAAELVNSAPDVIVTNSTPTLDALKQATRTIPIVFAIVNDPAGQGFVTSLAHPGGNITGFSYIDPPMVGKWHEILKEIAPGIKRTTLMFNPEMAPYYPAFLRDFKWTAQLIAAELSATSVRDVAEMEMKVSAFAREPGGGLIAVPGPFMNTHRALIMALAERLRLPVIYGFQRSVREGGLISYGPDTLDIVRRSALYVDRILKGAKPNDLPVQAPTKFELVINLKTAKALGLDVPASMQQLADEVIE
jgi:putative ABC transport system substrate-binding protein